MGVYELKATDIVGEATEARDQAASAREGRGWGRALLWTIAAVALAGALAGGGWLAYRAGQQAGATGAATMATGATAVTGAVPFGPGDAMPAGGPLGLMANATAPNALAASETLTQSVAAAQGEAANITASAAAPAQTGRMRASAASETAAVASADGATGGLGALSVAAQAAPVAINTQPNALESAATRTTTTSSGMGTTASIPAIVSAANTPLLSDAGAALATLDSGDSLKATARSIDSQWLVVQSGVTNGWVARDAVIAYGIGDLATAKLPAGFSAIPAAPAAAPEAVSPAGTVTLVTTGPVGPTTAAANAQPVVTAGAVEVAVATSAANLNVRAGPGTEYAIVGKAASGTTLTPVARNATADWLKVTLASGDSGWAASAYLTVTGDPQTLPVEAAHALPPQPASTASPAAASAGPAATIIPAAAESAAAASLSGTLAFQQSPSGTIWTYDFVTGATKSLTSGFDPAISPDGSTIAFVREGGEAGLYLIDSDGSNERLIFAERGRLSAPKWSDDGQWILFGRGDEYYECYPMGAACLTEDELAAHSPHGTPLSLPSEIRYFDKLSVVDSDGNNFHDIPSLTSAKAADWANGNIVYQSSAGLHRTAAGTDDADQLVIFEPLMTQFQDPDWQPSGSQIVFQKKGAAQWDIWAVNADGSNMHGLTKAVTTLVDTLPSNVAPAFSPDGAHIVYLSNRTEGNEAGAWRLWVMDADGSNARALPIDVPIDYTFGVEQVVSWGG